jgi:hypothetical protein
MIAGAALVLHGRAGNPGLAASGSRTPASVAPAPQLEAMQKQGASIDPRKLADSELKVDEIIKAKGDPQILARFETKTELGKHLARLAMTVRLSKQVPKDQLAMIRAAYLGGFLANREEVIATAKQDLSQLAAPELAYERMGVYGVLTALPGIAPVLQELSYNELTQLPPPARPEPQAAGLTKEQYNSAMSWGAQQVLPLMAYTFYLRATDGQPDVALNGTLAALTSQQDSGIRVQMVTGFVTMYPNLKPQLYAGLTTAGITVPDVQPSQPGPPGMQSAPSAGQAGQPAVSD